MIEQLQSLGSFRKWVESRTTCALDSIEQFTGFQVKNVETVTGIKDLEEIAEFSNQESEPTICLLQGLSKSTNGFFFFVSTP